MRKVIAAASVLLLVLGSACASVDTTEEGAATGGLVGAGAGAVIGHQSGHTLEGGLIGAGVGAVTGAVVGHERQND